MARFWLAVAVLMLTAYVLETRSASQEDQTWDEAMHLTAGYQYWQTGDFTRNWQHPPFAKLWAALPLVSMQVKLPASSSGEVEYAREFLFSNNQPHDAILGAARRMMSVLSVALILAVAWFANRNFGWIAGLVAAGLMALDPNFLAHGHYVTTDVPVSLFFFLTCALWAEYRWKGRLWALLGAGVALGLALGTKFSAVVLVPLLALLYWLPGPGRRSIPDFVKSYATVLFTGFVVLWLVYLPWHRQPDLRAFAETVPSETTVGRTLRWVGETLKLKPHPYLAGLDQVAEHNRSGHPSYLMGTHYDDGRWHYFPTAFAVKTPLGALVLGLLALLLAKRDGRFWMLLVPFALFFAFCVSGRMNLGIRHLMPVYPFFFVAIGAAFVLPRVTRAKVVILALAAALQIWEVARIHPHYLAFFNAAAGGPGAGPRYLLDSNLDWGQDLGNLTRWVRAHGEEKVCLTYFGSASWEVHRMRFDNVPKTHETEQIRQLDCFVAASATVLYGLYVQPDDFKWLREKEPVAKIGWSIYVWDMRKKH